MPPSSPYQPPRSAITPAAPTQYGEIHPFSARGRLGRVRYIGYSVGLGLLINLLTAGWGGALAALANGNPAEWVGLGGVLLLVALGGALSILLSIQRLHDFGASGWWSALVVAPFANLVLYLVLLIMPGTQGANRFGHPPPPNTLGVLLLALVLPTLFILGILAAIAIPAYQDYARRAALDTELSAPAPPRP